MIQIIAGRPVTIRERQKRYYVEVLALCMLAVFAALVMTT